MLWIGQNLGEAEKKETQVTMVSVITSCLSSGIIKNSVSGICRQG